MLSSDDLEDLNDKLQLIAGATTDDFVSLVRLAGLDPKEDLCGTDLTRTALSGQDLQGFNFSDSNLSYADMRGANLKGAILDRANLEGAMLDGASLRHASLKGANLKNASCRDVDLDGVDLSGVRTEDAVIEPRLSQPATKLYRGLRDPRETLIGWLNDAYVMEKTCIQVFEKRAHEVKDIPELYRRYAQHLEVTKMHSERVRDMVQRLGGDISAMKSAMGTVPGSLQGHSSGSRSEELVKNILADYSSEQLQIASYRAVVVAARALGEQLIVRVCEEILRDEEDMAGWLERALPTAVDSHVGQVIRAAEPVW